MDLGLSDSDTHTHNNSARISANPDMPFSAFYAEKTFFQRHNPMRPDKRERLIQETQYHPFWDLQYRFACSITSFATEKRKYSGVGTSVPYGSGLIYQTMKPDRLNRPDFGSGPDPCGSERRGYWVMGMDAGHSINLPIGISSEEGPKKVVMLGNGW